MKNKNYIKKTLTTLVSSACVAISIPVVANSIAVNQNTFVVSQQQNSSYVNGRDVNNHPDFKTDIKLVGTYENDKGVNISTSPIKSTPSLDGVTYKDLPAWEKSYDGKNFTRINPNGTDMFQRTQFFFREDREFQVRRVIDWYLNIRNWEEYRFTTTSKPITINKKNSTNVDISNKTNQNADYKIYLNGLNNDKETIKFDLIKEYENKSTIINSSQNQFKEVNKVSEIKKDNKGFYFDLKTINQNINDSKYTFKYEIVTNDTTKRSDSISIDVKALNKNFSIQSPNIISETHESVDVKINFDKYDLINDYVISFIEIDEHLNPVPNGYTPEVEKINDFQYRIFKANSTRKYGIKISSSKLGSEIINLTDANLLVLKRNQLVNPEPELPGNPSLPNDGNVVGTTKNSSFNSSTIAILSVVSLIALIAIVCSIILFINLRKNNKK